MVSNYWISGFVAYIHTAFQQLDIKIILGLDMEEEFGISFSFDALVYCRSASDLCVIGPVFRWQLSYVHQKGGITAFASRQSYPK